jgi:hypothetical protein
MTRFAPKFAAFALTAVASLTLAAGALAPAAAGSSPVAHTTTVVA